MPGVWKVLFTGTRGQSDGLFLNIDHRAEPAPKKSAAADLIYNEQLFWHKREVGGFHCSG